MSGAPDDRAVRVLYSDLDGTMVGPHGCLVTAEDGSWTLDAAAALVDLHRAGVALVLVSGRTRPQLVEATRLLGADGFVGELGAVLGWERGRRVEVLCGELPADLPGTPREALEGTGAVDRLLARHAGRLEHHAPWHREHEADVMLRGLVDVAALEAELAADGCGWVQVLDNGTLPVSALGSVPGVTTTLRLEQAPHVYHLMPRGLSKGLGVARDLARRGLRPEQAVAVGDSSTDLAMADAVGRMHLVANGARDPAVRAEAERRGVAVTAGAMGAGWVEVVRELLG